MYHCLFCKILRGEIKSEKILETEEAIVIRDVHPKAPVHILSIPKSHLTSLADATKDDQALLGATLFALTTAAEQLGVAENGYRTIINTRAHGGQEIGHLHIHLLGGEPLGPMRS